MELSRIKEAAVKQGDEMITGKRHGDIILAICRVGGKRVAQEDQGFVTEAGEFLSRSEAYDRAVACGQIKDNSGDKRLFSEMLY
jgi:hypothetical protein